MHCLVDTNVLVYATVESAPRHAEARAWMTRLQREGFRLCTTPQVYREYLVVLTRGLIFEHAFDPDEALDALSAMRLSFEEVLPASETLGTLLSLVRRYGVRGKRVHDAQIAALMLTHGVERLATYNTKDFDCFDEITLLAPPQPEAQ